MKTAEMKLRCSVCSYYRMITYADGHHSIGCMKLSADGIHPVDIISLDRCPRSSRKRRDNSVDRSELLVVLAKIYGKVAVNPDYISLRSLLKSAGPTVRKKSQHIAKALVQLQILKVVSRSEKGRRGMHCKYIWNLSSVGPPSLDMTDKINEKVQSLVEEATSREYDKKAASEIKPSRELLVDSGATSCEHCWMKDITDCRERVKATGIDCKSVNINTIRYAETTVG